MTNKQRFLPVCWKVVFLLPECGQLIGLISMLEVFDAANRIRRTRGLDDLFECQFAGLSERATSVSGVVIETREAHRMGQADMVVVGGGLNADGTAGLATDPRFDAEVGRLADSAALVVSNCTGAFVLGGLGLLDGKRCTSHWLTLDALRARFPSARVEPDALYTEDGRIATSAGASAGADLALHLVRRLGGSRLALTVARTLVVFAHRPGGQSQFGTSMRLRPSADERMRRVVASILADPADDHQVNALARRCGMSPRNFARVFREEMGRTPASFVSAVRVEAAQRVLVYGDDAVDAVAVDVGFKNTETFRRTFVRVAGVTPSAYRVRFRGS